MSTCTCDDEGGTQTLTVTSDGRSSTCTVTTSDDSTTCTLDMYISDSMQNGTSTIAYSGESSYYSNLKDVCSSGKCDGNTPFSCTSYDGDNCTGGSWDNDPSTCTVTTTDDDGKKSCTASIAYKDKTATLTQSYDNKYALECAQDESCTKPGWDITKNCKC